MEYEMPYKDLPAQKEARHRVVLWELASGEEGTGFVHVAPGCGPEDYDLGKKENLSSPSPLDEEGVFIAGYENLSGKHVSYVNPEVIKDLESRGFIYKLEKIKHRYPHCTRCGTQLVFRLVDEWYIKMDEIRPKLIEQNQKIKWNPPQGQKYEDDWLHNMGDWLISRKRYYGLPLPIWECSCGHFEVIGSVKELKKKAVEGFSKLKELHRPWVDEVKIRCPKCQGKISRIKDTGDVWLDAGMVPFFTLDYLTKKKHFESWYPADFVTECGPGQYRCWFYSMIMHGVTLTEKAPFKSILAHELVKDDLGKEMHKSWGNAIWLDEAADKIGADILRWRYYMQNVTRELWFSWKDAEEVKKCLNILWNLGNYLQIYFGDDFRPKTMNLKLTVNKWLVSRLESCKKNVNQSLEELQPYLAAEALQEFFMNTLSREYVHFIRDILGEEESKEKEECLQVLYRTYLDSLALLAPFIPFTTEKIYQDIFTKFQKEKSIHLFEYPKANEKLIDKNLEEEIFQAQKIISDLLASREKLQRSIRWPLKQVTIITEDEKLANAILKHVELVKQVANILEIKIQKETPKEVKQKVRTDYKKLAPRLGKDTPEVIAKIALLSPESLLDRINKQGKYIVRLNSGGEKEILKDDLMIEESLPDYLKSFEGQTVKIYADISETPEMLSSGFGRELARAVQALRKKSNLQKPDRIRLVVQADSQVAELLKPRAKEIQEKVGAKSCVFGKLAGKHQDKIKIRNKEISFAFDKS
jgi:isoleucyl-tRNA synthetase